MRPAIWLSLLALAACSGEEGAGPVRSSGPVVQTAATAPPAATVAPAAGRGALVLHGGGGDASGLAQLILDHAGARPTFCLIETAAGELGGSDSMFRGRSDVGFEVLDLSHGDAQQPETVAVLQSCSGYFFNGGDPQRLSDAFLSHGRDTPALAAIRERFRNAGALVSGSSAGAMIVGPVTLCECGARSSLVALQEGQLFQAPGFHMIEGVLIDAHFFARGLLGRHMFALARNRIRVGVGIDEDTSVIVPPDGGPWSVAGNGAVAVVEAPPGATPSALNGFRLSILLPGDRFDPLRDRREIAPSRLSVALQSKAELPPPWTDRIFDPGGVRAVVKALIESPAASAVGLAADNAIRVTFRKTPETRAFGGPGGYSVLDLEVSIERQP